MVKMTKMKKMANMRSMRYVAVFFVGMFLGGVVLDSGPQPACFWDALGAAPNDQPRQVLKVSDDKEKYDKKYSFNDQGWNSIQLFQGSVLPAVENKPAYSQCHQDLIVLHLLNNKKEGFFVDLAANDAIDISNTLVLERRNHWKGICVEPNPHYWADLAKYRTCQIVGAAVGGTKDEPVDFVFRGAFGGIRGYDNQKGATQKLRTATLVDILQRNQAPHVIDYLSLDVEGAEFLVMKDFPFDKYKIKVMTIERPNNELKALLQVNGYEYIRDLAFFGETLWVNKAFKQELNLDGLEPLLACQSLVSAIIEYLTW